MTQPTSNALGSSLASLFPSMAMARLVVFFAVHPGQRFHLRELKRRTRLSSASLQRELRRLVDSGALEREEGDDHRVHFTQKEAHDAWRAWTLLLRSIATPADVLREALVDARGVEGAFVYGSTVRGDARPGSDVDVFLIVREREPSRAWRRQLSEVEFLLGRPLDVVEYSVGTAQPGARSGNPFLRRILAEPKTWICGGPESLGATEAL
ncbi:MAG: nucleotidyltransferase domain-containing protein [Longimicrobiales bacterium]|nr:nucleotidyltransferase domain-containing protein [Longimicrobiales bacterium]